MLRKWKQHQGLRATYRNLLTVCCEARASEVAGAICEALRNHRIESKGAILKNILGAAIVACYYVVITNDNNG